MMYYYYCYVYYFKSHVPLECLCVAAGVHASLFQNLNCQIHPSVKESRAVKSLPSLRAHRRRGGETGTEKNNLRGRTATPSCS